MFRDPGRFPSNDGASSSMSAPNYQIAIVGGGVAGLYTAWRLTRDSGKYHPSDVVMYEASDRWGGRLFTWHLPTFDTSLSQDPFVRAELGGMRIATTHTYVGSLSNHLNIPFASFAADVDSNYHYLRGGFMTGATLDSQTTEGPLYRLAPNESGETPSSIVFNALTGGSQPLVSTSMLPGNNGTTLRGFVDYCLGLQVENEGISVATPLYNWGFWNIVINSGAVAANQNTISNEAYAFYREAYAYDTIPANWNAAVAVSAVLADFGKPAPTYYALATGYQTLPLTLQQQLDPRITQANMPITAITWDGSTFSLYTRRQELVATAQQLVLALPPRALHIIFRNTHSHLEGVNRLDFLDMLAQSSPIPLFKVFLVYNQTDWWTQAVTPQGTSGAAWPAFTRMTTDMPMRQIYNFGYAPAQYGQACQLFQASYSDSLYAGYWAGLMPACDIAAGAPDVSTDPFARVVPAEGRETIATGLISFDSEEDYQTYPLFALMHNQFVNLVTQVGAQQSPPVTVQPTPPVAGAAMNWATDPFGGGVNFWNVGVDINSAYGQMLQPFNGSNGGAKVPMYIVGEGYSLMQGWVEGALWSVEDMFQQSGLCPTPPRWLNTSAVTFTPTTVVPDPAAYGLPQS
jgi:predicted NAD/FAD-dependent oxidoreductase